MRTLILFDVDGTLISTSRAGIAAMGDAGRELFSPDFTTDQTEFAGRLDPLILADLLTHNEQPVTPQNIDAMRRSYKAHLTRRLSEPGIAKALPGVHDLTAALWSIPDVCTGLLTGNYEETGRIKLSLCGLEFSRFHLAVWGTDSPHDPPSRDHLPPVGLARFKHRYNKDIDPAGVIIIGDTPHDITCAACSNCRSIGVATGKYTPDELKAAGAGHVVTDLSDTQALLAHMLG